MAYGAPFGYAPDQADAAWTDLIRAIYARVEYRSASELWVTFTPAANSHGVALALPRKVQMGPSAAGGAPGGIRGRIARTGSRLRLG